MTKQHRLSEMKSTRFISPDEINNRPRLDSNKDDNYQSYQLLFKPVRPHFIVERQLIIDSIRWTVSNAQFSRITTHSFVVRIS